jgi:hypothetical protein
MKLRAEKFERRKGALVKVVFIVRIFLCTPRVSKENVVVQAVGWVNIRRVVKTPVSCWDGRVAGSWRLDLCTEYVL